VEVLVASYEVMPKNNALTEFAAVLRTVAVGVWT
jgi:hypothetical protein